MTQLPRPSPAEQERLYRRIADALFSSIPQEWEATLLRVTVAPSAQLQLTISGPRDLALTRLPDGALYERTAELYDLFLREGRPFTRLDFRLSWDEANETWRFIADYAFDGTTTSPE